MAPFPEQKRFSKRQSRRASSVHDAHEQQLSKFFQSTFREEAGYKMEGMLLKREMNRGWDVFNTGLKFLNPNGPTEVWAERHVMLSLDSVDYFSYDDEEDKYNIFFTDIDRVHHKDSSQEGADNKTKPGSFRNKLLMNQALSASSTNLYGKATKELELGEFDFMILTSKDGFHRGEPIVFRASTQVDRDLWVAAITQVLLMRRDYELHQEPVSNLQRTRRIVRWYYMHQKSQLLVAFLITFNFMANVVDHQNNSPSHEPGSGAFEKLDLAFTCIFVIELSVNLFSTLVWEFLSDGWNYFDFLVVLVSIMSLAAPNIPGGSTLKLTRTFRVFRLFKRIRSMRRIMASLIHALPAMANAYVLLTLLTAIYAILGVNFFKNVSEERFGSFFSSMFTLWQIMTGDDWSVLVRELFQLTGSPIGVGLFFVSFQLLVTFTMVNVVVCVLLEGFSSAGAGDNSLSKSYHGSKSVEEWHRHVMLFPLMRQLTRCRDTDHLHKTVLHVFSIMVTALPEGSDKRQLRPFDIRLSFEEARGGLMEVPVHPPPMLHRPDWEQHVERAGLADVDGEIGVEGFEELVHVALKQYQMHCAERAVETCHMVDPRTVNRTLAALKGRLFAIDYRKRKEERLAVTRMRWGEGYEQGDVARGGWGPGSTQAAPCGTG